MTADEMKPYIGKNVIVEFKFSYVHSNIYGILVRVDKNAFDMNVTEEVITWNSNDSSPLLPGPCCLSCSYVTKIRLQEQTPAELYGSFIGGGV